MMATIDDLNISITQMTTEQLMTLLLERRKCLRTRVESKGAKQTRENKEKKSVLNMNNLVNGLTGEQKAKLLSELGAM